MADYNVFLKPDSLLRKLEEDLNKATTAAKRQEIQNQINARQLEISQEFGSVGFGSGGYVIPNYAYSEASGNPDLFAKQQAIQKALAGKEQLLSTGTNAAGNYSNVYQKQYYGPQGQTGYVMDPETGQLVDQYEYANKITQQQLAGTAPKSANLKLFYDANGKQLSPEEVAKTPQGQAFAKAGWDIGFGSGVLPPQFEGSVTPSGNGTANLTIPNGQNSTSVTTATNDANKAKRVSAYNILQDEFNKYGLGSLVSDIKNYLIDNTFDPSEFSIQLQNTDAYKKRFAANQDRINKGLAALTPAQYIALEDQYQEVMRRYGLPASYYTKGDLGIQEGFNKLISNDVSSTELEDRIMTAQNRLINTDVNTLDALRKFYPTITNGDLLAYTLDPTNAINDIKRKATAAEIGGAALAQLGEGALDVNTAETLAKYGINKAQAQQGYATIGQILPTASQLGDIYAKQGLGPYTQGTAEAEIFNTAGAAEAARKRRRLAELEQATFGGSSGNASNALNRDRAMTNQMLGTPGAGQF